MCIYEKYDKQRKIYICTNILTEAGANCSPCTGCCLYKAKITKQRGGE